MTEDTTNILDGIFCGDKLRSKEEVGRAAKDEEVGKG